MYSDGPHIVDVFNDSDEVKATFKVEKDETDGWERGFVILKFRMKKDKVVAPDSTGSVYAHITDGVQHARLIITPEEEQPTPKKGKK